MRANGIFEEQAPGPAATPTLTPLTLILTTTAKLNFLQEDEFEEVEVDVKYKTITTLDWERVNANVAIWARDKDEITDDEYHNFYKVQGSGTCL